MNELIEKIRLYALSNAGRIVITLCFIIAFIFGWCMNGLKGATFDLYAVMAMYGLLIGKDVATHTINSMYNSPKGERPVQHMKKGDI